MRATESNIVFDIGQVLLIWDPRLLYGKLIPDNAEREDFFETVLNWTWRDRSDFSMTVQQNCELGAREHPQHAPLIQAWTERFFEMMPGPVPGAWDLTAELQSRGSRVYSIANFAADKYAAARVRFPFLNCLDGMLVSSEVNLKKPDPQIYRAFLRKFNLDAADCIFIDDDPANVEGAEAVGMTGYCHRTIPETRAYLADRGLLAPR